MRLIISLSMAVATTLIFSSFSSNLELINIGITIIVGIITFCLVPLLTLFYNLDRMVRKLLILVIRQYPNLHEIQKKSFLLFLGRLSNEREIKLSDSTIKDYIELLEAGVEYVKQKWFTTYKLPVENWLSFGEYATSYHMLLNNRNNIEKTRCVIRPLNEISDRLSMQKTDLVNDTINAGASINFYSHEKIQGFKYLKKIPDFALFDDELVITADIQIPQNNQQLTLDDKVNIKIFYGNKTNKFKGWSDRLLNHKPEHTF